ncbi:hypothetical protein HHI36_020091 [Cryptolaemus montrouzieri]|uniref:G-protein coupled receptors family 1 profile domain-containing protein n=1 Tax=Cryptolaemus montrouzieri TaxID=559131 RepID=A0ABD2N9W7_9CUCU
MDILALTNSAINFVLYCSMSRQFRVTFHGLFVSKLFGACSSNRQQAIEENGVNLGDAIEAFNNTANTRHSFLD